MKAFLLSALLLVSFVFGQTAYARDYIETTDLSDVRILDLVEAVHKTYSHSSEVEAKLFELLVGDGMNPSRMVLVLNNGYGESRIFDLEILMSTVKKIHFLNTDVLVIHYIQDEFDNMEDMKIVKRNRTITLEIIRNEDGALSNLLRIIK